MSTALLACEMSGTVCQFEHSLALPFFGIRTSLVAQTVKRLSTMWETQVRSLGPEDPLEEGMATHSVLVLEKPEEPEIKLSTSTGSSNAQNSPSQASVIRES